MRTAGAGPGSRVDHRPFAGAGSTDDGRLTAGPILPLQLRCRVRPGKGFQRGGRGGRGGDQIRNGGDDFISGQVIAAALRVHSILGPGLLESAYEACLVHELRKRRLQVASQVPLTILYDGVRIKLAYRLDLLVEDSVVVELKTVAQLLPVHRAQLLSYLRLGHHKIGLLMNFHELRLRDGIRRVVNGA